MMASAECEHCHSPMLPGEKIAAHDGFSYHKKCYKCYVCSETNLHDAEVFKGVIFCSSCAQRIFQGCASARRTKQRANNRVKRSRSRSYARRTVRDLTSSRRSKPPLSRHSRSRQLRKRDTSRPQDRREFNCVIQRATAHMGVSTSGSSNDIKKVHKAGRPIMTAELLPEKMISKDTSIVKQSKNDLNKNSAEMGVITDATQKLLAELTDHLRVPLDKPLDNKETKVISPSPHSPRTTSLKEVSHRRNSHRSNAPKGDSPRDESPRRKSPKRRTREKHRTPNSGANIAPKKSACSDMRMAELGVSTEIAYMALRKKSELPVIIKSSHQPKKLKQSISLLNQESDEEDRGWMTSTYTTRGSINPSCLDRRLGSILKIPYAFFKENVLKRSSLVSVLMSKNSNNKTTWGEQIRTIFYEDVIEHRGRGMRALYSTINRKTTPYKLGWLNLVSNCSGKPRSVTGRRCNHFNSHSYRCMRAQVLSLAGPTVSQLRFMRCKIKRFFVPKFVRHAARYLQDSPQSPRKNYNIQTVFQADPVKPITVHLSKRKVIEKTNSAQL